MNQDDNRNERALKEITDIISTRQQYYGKVLVGIALSHNDAKELRLRYGLIHFLRKGENPEEQTYDYDNFVLLKRVRKIPEVITLLEMIAKEQHIKVDKFPRMPLPGRLKEPRSALPFTRYGYFHTKWSSYYAYYSIRDDELGRMPQEPLVKRELPGYPDGYEAIRSTFGLPSQADRLDGRIELIIPDYRARIHELSLTSNKILLKVELGELATRDLVVKIFCRTSDSVVHTPKELLVSDYECVYEVDGELLWGETYLVSVKDEDRIDSVRFDFRFTRHDPRIRFEEMETVPSIVHQHLDPDFETLEEWVRGEGRQSSRNFEQGMSILLSLLGFIVEYLGLFEKLLQKRSKRPYGVDIIAYSPDGVTVVLGQCISTAPHNKKVINLKVTAKEIESRIQGNIIPVIFTLIEEETIKDEVERLAKEGIRVIGKQGIEQLLTFVRRRTSLEHVLRSINLKSNSNW